MSNALAGTPAPVGVGRNSPEMAAWCAANGQCPETVYGTGRWGGYHICRKPIKNTERGMCGIHARAAQNREDKEAARKARRSASDNNWAKGQQSANQIAEILGIDKGVIAARNVRSDLSTFFTGGVTLDPDAVEALINLLTKEA